MRAGNVGEDTIGGQEVRYNGWLIQRREERVGSREREGGQTRGKMEETPQKERIDIFHLQSVRAGGAHTSARDHSSVENYHQRTA